MAFNEWHRLAAALEAVGSKRGGKTSTTIDSLVALTNRQHARIVKLRVALEALTDLYIANRGTPSQLLSCITSDTLPSEWQAALAALDETEEL